MQYRFLTDAVAAGLPLDEVNEEWAQAEIEIRKAFNKRRRIRREPSALKLTAQQNRHGTRQPDAN
jgi:hypothetical protein